MTLILSAVLKKVTIPNLSQMEESSMDTILPESYKQLYQCFTCTQIAFLRSSLKTVKIYLMNI